MLVKKKNSRSQTILLALVLILAVVLAFLLSRFVLVGTTLYPKALEHLDLRGQNLTLKEYQALSEKLPDCEILWDVTFQGTAYSSDTRELTVTSLTDRDVEALTAFPELETLNAQDCYDYDQLTAVRQAMPQVQVNYQILLAETGHDPDLETVTLKNVPAEEIERLDYMQNLKAVTVDGGSWEAIARIRDYCQQRDLDLHFQIAGETVDTQAAELTITGITDEDLPVIPVLENLKKLHLASPKAAAENIFSLPVAYPEIKITWDYTIGGKTMDSSTKDLDLSGMALTDLKEVETAVSYFPEVESVFLGVQDGLKNEDVAAFRERQRENYKVVWEVRFGDTRTLRTDITYFMPGRDWARGPSFGDEIAYNLRYCEDLICVDVGHLGLVKHVDWLEGLVNLEYLILAHTDIRSLEGIQHCKKLKFLELHWTGIKDLTPLKECTALEDLNFGKAYPDITPLLEMPWLKNIWMIYGSSADAYKLSQALPDTKIVCSGNATVGSGWRRLPNYYKMRDALGAPYDTSFG